MKLLPRRTYPVLISGVLFFLIFIFSNFPLGYIERVCIILFLLMISFIDFKKILKISKNQCFIAAIILFQLIFFRKSELFFQRSQLALICGRKNPQKIRKIFAENCGNSANSATAKLRMKTLQRNEEKKNTKMGFLLISLIVLLLVFKPLAICVLLRNPNKE
jgi:hypothetical protein